MTAEGYTGDDGGSVDSVNGETGAVVLDAADVDADPTGTAAALVEALTAADVGADPAGTAAGLVAALDAADVGADPSGTAAALIAALGPLLRTPAQATEQVATWTAADEWLRVNGPASPGDNNPDFARFFYALIKVLWLNGNFELRTSASTASRVGYRGYEYPNGSTDVFWQLSTNPSDAGLRESLLDAYGTLHATRPGWIVLRETLRARRLEAVEQLTVGGQGVPASPTYVAATLGTSIVKRTGTADPGSSLERGRVFWRGTLQWASGLAVGAGYQLAQVTSDHRPQTEKSFPIRTIGAGSNISTSLHLSPDGWLTPEVSLGTASATVHLPLDGINWDLS